MKAKNRLISLLLIIAVVMGMAAACSPAAAPETTQPAAPAQEEAAKTSEPVTINFMADSRSEFVNMQKLLPAFTEKTGISVNMVQLQETPLRAKTGLELSAPSTDIDVIMTDFQLMRKYAAAGVLAPLDDALANTATFNEADYQAPFLDALRYEGSLYGLPLYQDTNILMYRADIFAELGLDVPKTVADLEAVAKAITDWGKDQGTYGIALRGQRGMGVNEWTWPAFLWAFGGSYYKDFPNDMHPNLDSPEAIEALEYYVNMINNYAPPGAANYSYVEVQTDLMQGKTAMIIDSATLGIRAEDPEQSTVAGKLGYAVMPGGPGGQQPGFYTWSVVVPAKAPHKEAAAQFLAWMLSPEIAPQIGWSAPDQALEGVYAIPAYPGYDQSEPLIDIMKQSLALADPDYRPRVPEQTEVGTEISVAISDAIAGTKTAEQALKDANEAVDKIMENAGYYDMVAQPAEAATPVEPVTINFMADSRSEFVNMQKLLPAFTEKTGISVNMVQLQETPLRAKTGLELSAPSTDIDVIMTDFQLMRKYAAAGVLAPLDDALANTATFNEADYQAPFLDALRYEGSLYGLPLYQDTNILMYRADIFAELGLDVPKTVADLEAVAKAITDWGKDQGTYGIALRGQRGMGVNEWTWPAFLWAFGGSYYKDFPNDMHPNLDSPEAIEALEYYVNMINNYAPPGAANYSYVEVQTDLMQGKTAMIIDSATLGIRAEDPEQSTVAGKLGYAVMPGGPGGQQPGFYTWSVVVPAKAPHKEAAAQFLAWMLSPEIAPQIGWSAPDQALEGVYAIPAYPGYDQSEPLIDIMKQSLALADADYRPRVPEQTEVGTEISVAISDAIAGTKTAEQALMDANEAIDKIMQKAGYY